MALIIKIPESAYHEQNITLGNVNYTLILKYNNSDHYWYFDLYNNTSTPLVSGIKVMPNQCLTGRYPYREVLEDGNIWCLRTRQDYSDVGRNNLGIGKTYELIWLSSAEEEEFGIDGTIQL